MAKPINKGPFSGFDHFLWFLPVTMIKKIHLYSHISNQGIQPVDLIPINSKLKIIFLDFEVVRILEQAQDHPLES